MFYYLLFQILFDFEVSFPEIDANALQNIWSRLEPKLLDNNNMDTSEISPFDYPNVIQAVLNLFRIVLQPKNVKHLTNSVNELIVYIKDNYIIKDLKRAIHPYIIANGDTIKNITNYYIHVEDFKICVSTLCG